MKRLDQPTTKPGGRCVSPAVRGCQSALLAAGCLVSSAALAAVFNTNTTMDTVDANIGDGTCADAAGSCSLRAAVQETNALAGMDRINLGPGTYLLTLTGAGEDMGASGDLDISSPLTIMGIGATIDADNIDRALDVLGSASLRVSRVNIVNGTPPNGESGGGIRSAGSLTVTSSTIQDCSVSGSGASGGAIFNDGGSVNIVRTTLARNSAERAGGGVEANGGDTRIAMSRLVQNQTGPSPGNGGGLHITGDGDADVLSTTVVGNTAASEGGGLWNSSGTMNVRNTTLSENFANGDAADNGGGGLFNNGGTLNVVASTLAGNNATGTSGSGGGIFNNDGMLSVHNSVIDQNNASRAGGGIESLNGENSLVNVTLSRNSTGSNPGNGGGMHITGTGNANVIGGYVTANSAAAEGGGLWNAAGTMNVRTVVIDNNVATGTDATNGGGGLFNNGGTMLVLGSTITGNEALEGSGSGGGAFNDGGMLTIAAGTRIEGNSSARAGGGVEANGGNTMLNNMLLAGNSTGPSPGNGGGLHLTGDGVVRINLTTVDANNAAAEGGNLWNSAVGTMIVTRSTSTNGNAPVGPNNFNDGGLFVFNGAPVAP